MTATEERVTTYRANPGSRLSDKDAQVIGPELERLASAHGDGFDAGLVVEVARPPDAPLHGYFEWRERVAAEQYRLSQARGLVRSVEIKIEVRRGPEPQERWVRQFHHVEVAPTTDEGKPETRYVPLAVVRRSDDYSKQVLESAQRELKAWGKRYSAYRHLREFEEPLGTMFDAIERMAAAD